MGAGRTAGTTGAAETRKNGNTKRRMAFIIISGTRCQIHCKIRNAIIARRSHKTYNIRRSRGAIGANHRSRKRIQSSANINVTVQEKRKRRKNRITNRIARITTIAGPGHKIATGIIFVHPGYAERSGRAFNWHILNVISMRIACSGAGSAINYQIRHYGNKLIGSGTANISDTAVRTTGTIATARTAAAGNIIARARRFTTVTTTARAFNAASRVRLIGAKIGDIILKRIASNRRRAHARTSLKNIHAGIM
jgi:hypothetical protein